MIHAREIHTVDPPPLAGTLETGASKSVGGSPGNRPRHLMQVVYSLLQGGSERLACDLAIRLDPSWIRSSICALAFGGPLADTLRQAAIPFRIAGCGPGREWRMIPKLYRLFRAERVDLVQTHHIKQLVYSGLGARLAGAKLIHVEHDSWSLRAPRAQRLLRALAPLCYRIVVVGDAIRDFLVREVGLPAAQVSVIPNGVDMTRYRPQPTLTREALGLPARGRLVGHVARLEAEKDQETLLRAFCTVLTSHAAVRLVLVGEGSRRAELQELAGSLGIAERVHFLGPRADVADLLPHLDAFVLSSLHEGLPLAILEAMACARPVVATAVGEIPQVIRHGVTGLTVPLGNPAALAAAISAVLDGPEWAAAMGRSARQLIEERFSLAGAVARYQSLYDALLPPAGKPLGASLRVNRWHAGVR